MEHWVVGFGLEDKSDAGWSGFCRIYVVVKGCFDERGSPCSC